MYLKVQAMQYSNISLVDTKIYNHAYLLLPQWGGRIEDMAVSTKAATKVPDIEVIPPGHVKSVGRTKLISHIRPP